MYLVEKKVKLAIHLLDATRQEQQHVVEKYSGGGGGQSASCHGMQKGFLCVTVAGWRLRLKLLPPLVELLLLPLLLLLLHMQMVCWCPRRSSNCENHTASRAWIGLGPGLSACCSAHPYWLVLEVTSCVEEVC